MRNVLLDEMLPIGVAQLLPGHDVQTAVYAGLAGISNGHLIAGAVEKGVDVLVTLDRGIPEQQNLGAANLGVVLIPDNDPDKILPYVEMLREAVASVEPGQVLVVTPAG